MLPFASGVTHTLGHVYKSATTTIEQVTAGHLALARPADMDPQSVASQHKTDEADMPIVLSTVMLKAYRLFKQTNNPRAIELAVISARQVISTSQENDPNRAGWLNNLGIMLESRYGQTGAISDLEEAIDISQKAIDAVPESHPDRAGWLSNLGIMIGNRYERTEATSDLEEAIDISQRAVDAIPEGHRDRAACLTNLGSKLYLRYERTGSIDDLGKAIDIAQKMVDGRVDNHPDRASALNNLGIMLESRHERTGAIGDLEKAIDISQKAVEAVPEGHRDRATCLNSLGSKLYRRYERTGSTGDLEEAINADRQALGATVGGHPDRAGWLNNLGTKLHRRYERTGAIGDLEEAMDIIQKAVDITHGGHPTRAGWLNNLGVTLESQYEQTGAVSDLEKAINATRQAVNATPDDHPKRVGRLFNLGGMLESRYKQSGAICDLEEASTQLNEAWNIRIAPPFFRIKSAARCIRLLACQEKMDAAAQLGKDAIRLLPSMNIKFLDYTDQQYVVSNFAGVASNLCALLLALGQVEDALLYLEQGRTVILSQLMDNKSDISELAKTYPEITRRYEEIRNEVNTPIHSVEQNIVGEQMLQQRLQSISDLEACVKEIRAIPGRERFLLPQSIVEMKECAAGGYIVIVNVTSFRSDAILISPTIIEAINLPDLSASDAEAWLSRDWTGGRRAERGMKNREYSAYLAWLWHSCVKLVLDMLHEIRESAVREPIRIWWIRCGLASSMPFHAAGIHDASTNETAYHNMVSSYSPSIKTLSYAREQDQNVTEPSGPLLVVTMPTTPPKDNKTPPNLPGVNEEKEKLLEVSRAYIAGKSIVQPSVDQALAHLEQCYIAHFACHGTTDPLDPSRSGLILQKQGETRMRNRSNKHEDEAKPVQDRLTVGRISEIGLKHAKLAYLSACSTAQNKAEKLSDEVIHVVSGFQVAGFPHVVGCLWPASDRVCVELADLFYASLFDQSFSQWKDGRIARALREAVMTIRAGDIDTPLNWAQFVHYGA